MAKKTNQTAAISQIDREIAKLNANIRRATDRQTMHVEEHQSIYDDIRCLTTGFLEKDLKAAAKYNRGYFKNKAGNFIYIKGVEVDGTCDLLRGGFNAEDRGVYVHYACIKDGELQTGNMPMCQFAYMMSDWEAKDKRYVPATKTEFDEAVKRLVSKACEPYEERHSVQEYINFMRRYESNRRLINKWSYEMYGKLLEKHKDDPEKVKVLTVLRSITETELK